MILSDKKKTIAISTLYKLVDNLEVLSLKQVLRKYKINSKIELIKASIFDKIVSSDLR